MKKETFKGKVIKVLGPIVSVEFEEGKLPPLFHLLKVEGVETLLEVEEYESESVARCLALGLTQGISRGALCEDLGETISVPEGEKVLGRIIDTLGKSLDQKGEIEAKRISIFTLPPPLSQQKSQLEILETGIKAIDLITPFLK